MANLSHNVNILSDHVGRHTVPEDGSNDSRNNSWATDRDSHLDRVDGTLRLNKTERLKAVVHRLLSTISLKSQCVPRGRPNRPVHAHHPPPIIKDEGGKQDGGRSWIPKGRPNRPVHPKPPRPPKKVADEVTNLDSL